VPDLHIIIAGDSNALGYLNTGPAPYTPTAQVQIWAPQPDGSFAWNYMNPGVNTGTPTNPADWGPEVQIANDWLKVHAGDGSHLWIVKDPATVKGGTTLAVDWAPGAPWFESTAKAAAAAMHNLDGGPYTFTHYDIAAVVLGENDAANHSYATAYAANLAAFLPAARLAWDVPNIVMPRIEETIGLADDNLAVRTTVWAEGSLDPHLGTFRTIGFDQQPDLVHYDAAGQVALGDGFWNTAQAEGWVW
jgi:hypothetical protein